MDKVMTIKHNKSGYWQVVRGVCILAVIMIHCPSEIIYSSIELYGWLILRQFINFPVVMFIFIAGYFVNTDKTRDNICAYFLIRGGDCSYGIFYVHMLVLMAVQKLVSVMGLEQIWILNFLLCFIMTAAGSYLIVWVTRNMAKKIGFDKALKIIGF